ncbi:MerR family transcriptional regulator [Aliishimia ponticola]|uniref:MerR family transcriptional regulator n=1 Tax=Aliishimia ponticola TaxID=2499833 RepID=A0A4S4NKF3_9RHOB|nr:MerR family transcriptional regulator [Aliishimia ponticola]THH38778.1 MerR family transcriptional regulator [Aliishimia ponticola]
MTESKSPDAFRTISEVAEWLGVQPHVLRFWESKFSQVKPVKRAGGRRYYRPADMLLLGGIKKLLHEDGLTIKGAQKILREEGMAHVSRLSQALDAESAALSDGAIDGVFEASAEPADPVAAPDPVAPVADEPAPDAPAVETPADTQTPVPSFMRSADPTTPEPAPAQGDMSAPADFAPAPTPAPREEAAPAPAALQDSPAEEPLPEETLAEIPTLAPDLDDEVVPEKPPEALNTPLGAPAAPLPDPVELATPSDAPEAAPAGPAEPAEAKLAPIPDVAETPMQVADEAPAPMEMDLQPAQDAPEGPADIEPAMLDSAEPEPTEAAPAEPEAPKPIVIDMPDPDEASFEVAPAVLTAAFGAKTLTPAQRRDVTPLVARLAALRDRMAAERGRR